MFNMFSCSIKVWLSRRKAGPVWASVQPICTALFRVSSIKGCSSSGSMPDCMQSSCAFCQRRFTKLEANTPAKCMRCRSCSVVAWVAEPRHEARLNKASVVSRVFPSSKIFSSLQRTPVSMRKDCKGVKNPCFFSFQVV